MTTNTRRSVGLVAVGVALGVLLTGAVACSGNLNPSPGPDGEPSQIHDRLAGGGESGVPKTGQTACYPSVYPFDEECTCGPPDCPAGQDGELQRGAAWPDPRFTDHGDGTVTDNLTGLVWLRKADCFFRSINWENALAVAAELASGSCGLTDGSSAGDWRLPNVREMQSVVDYGRRYNVVLPSGHPFTGVRSTNYWTSSTDVNYPDYAWTVDLDHGYVRIREKNMINHVWPVRGGQ